MEKSIKIIGRLFFAFVLIGIGCGITSYLESQDLNHLGFRFVMAYACVLSLFLSVVLFITYVTLIIVNKTRKGRSSNQ